MDGLERELEGQARVMRLSVMGSVGRELAARYGVLGVPTFVLLNGAGEVVLKQVGMPDRNGIKATLMDLGR